MIETTYGEGGFCADCDPEAHGHPLHNVISVEEVPDMPAPSPVQDIADALTANPDAFPDDILDLLRARLGLPGPA